MAQCVYDRPVNRLQTIIVGLAVGVAIIALAVVWQVTGRYSKPGVSSTSSQTSVSDVTQVPKVVSSASSSDPVSNTVGVVIGYIWESKLGSPKFKSLMLPRFNEKGKPYNIYVWDGNAFVFLQDLEPGIELKFQEGGVTKFKVLGIDPAQNICWSDPFMMAISFASTGTFNGTKTPITNNVPNKECQQRTAPKQLPYVYQGFLIPTEHSFPDGFVYSEEGESRKDGYVFEFRLAGGPIVFEVSEGIENVYFPSENYKERVKDLESRGGQKVKDFTWNGLEGVVYKTAGAREYYDLFLKDGDKFLHLSSPHDYYHGKSSGTAADSLIGILKTFERTK